MSTIALNQNREDFTLKGGLPPKIVPITDGTTGMTPGDNSGSIMQGGINPSAAAMLILYQVMGMYSKITGINAKQQRSEITAQKKRAVGEANAMKAAGTALMIGTVIAGGLAVTGALVSGALAYP